MKKSHQHLYGRSVLSIVVACVLLSSTWVVGMVYAHHPSVTKDTQVKITRADASGVDFSVSLDNYRFTTIATGGTSYDRVAIRDSGQTADYGKAELPTLSYYIAVPQDAEPALRFTTSNPVLLPGHTLYPAQYPKPDGDGFKDPPFAKNETFYALDAYYPSSVVDISPIMVMRGCRMVLITVYPMTYNPGDRAIKVYHDISIHVDFTGGTGEFIQEKYRSIYFQPLFNAFVLNSNCLEKASVHNQEGGVRSDDRADLLIVVANPLYHAILPLAAWRRATGLETKVVNWSEIGTSALHLRTYLKNAYFNWTHPPSFLLIVGDADQVPVNYLYTHPYHGTQTGTDLWYTAVDGSDYLPDIHAARISVENESQLTIVVNKILDYSKTPYMGSNWFNNILLAAYNEGGRYFIYTSERVYSFLSPLGYNCTRQYQGGSPPGSTSGVISAINSGVAIANHRDHGASQNDGYSYTGWSYPQFDTAMIPALTNGRMYPVMYSLNCDSGWFDGETDTEPGNFESIGEVGLRVENKGFAAVLASTRVSYSGYNDEFCCGLYDAMWSNFDPNYPNANSSNPFTTEVYRVSQVMNYGKFWMYDKYIVPGGCSPYPWAPSTTVSRATFEEFHMHGDPTMEVWTKFPQGINVTHPDTVPFQPSVVSVTVTTGSEKSPVRGAMVCLSQENGVYARNVTDATGTAQLSIEPQNGQNITIVVTAHNYLYYQGTIQVTMSNPPAQPHVPEGPTLGNAEIKYRYSTRTTDPDGDQVYYRFDWGDGNLSTWIGPYASGAQVNMSHAWMNSGNYSVRCRAKDIYGAQSDWSQILPVRIGIPALEIRRISGGIASLHVEVKNNGGCDGVDIPWTVTVKRYPSNSSAMYNKQFSGTSSSILIGATKKITCQPLVGIGGVKITVQAYKAEKIVYGVIAGIFLFVPPQ